MNVVPAQNVDETTASRIKYSAAAAIVKPIWTVSDQLGFFMYSGLFFAILLTALSYLFSQTYICIFNPPMAERMNCTTNEYLYFPYLLLKLMVLSVFITIWNDKVYQNKTLDGKYWSNLVLPSLRNLVVLLGFLLLNLIPALSGYLLLVRVPNPVWQIELAYFTVVAAGFVVPFILMRFYAVIAQMLDGIKPLNIKEAWVNTRGNGLKIVFSAAVMFLICILLFVSVNSTFQTISTMPAAWYNLIAEMIFNLVTLLIVAFLIGYMQQQKEMVLL